MPQSRPETPSFVAIPGGRQREAWRILTPDVTPRFWTALPFVSSARFEGVRRLLADGRG